MIKFLIMRVFLGIFGIVILLIFFVACDKNVNNQPVENQQPQYLLKVNFIDDWLNPQSADAYIFISDNSGSVLS